MTRLGTYTQKQLASSLVGTAPVNRSGQILASVIGNIASQAANITLNFAKEQKNAQDSIAINTISNSRDLAEAEAEQAIRNEPDPANWLGIWQSKLTTQQLSFVEQGGKLSNKAAKLELLEQKAFEAKNRIRVEIAAKDRFVEIDIKTSKENLKDKIAGNDGSLLSDLGVQKHIGLYQQALERKFTEEVADDMMEETIAAGSKAFFVDQGKLNPDETIADMRKRKKALGTSGKDIVGLRAKDYDDIIASALQAKNLEAQFVNEQQEVDRNTLGRALNSGDITYDMINNTSLPEKEQEIYRVRMNTEATRKSKGEPIITNQLIKGELEDAAYSIWKGVLDKEDYDEMLSNARYGKVVDGSLQYTFENTISDEPMIDDSAYDYLRSLGARELKTSQAKGLSESSFYAKGQLIEVESDIAFLAIIKSLGKPEQKAARSARKIQLENWSQFNRSMKLWQQANPDATESDYYIESRKKMPFYIIRSNESILAGEPVGSTKENRRKEYLRLKKKAKQ